ncbi:hypothetical protein HALA3H3_130030 [Halomonas sp. A3H3]|nr:hypothetical protein HALA3H3_130030 [Halomonas sp. A3H3]
MTENLDCLGHVSGLSCGALYGADNPHIGSAAADITVHMFNDLLTRGIGVALKKCRCLHELSGLAIAALRHLFVDPGLLKRMARIWRQPLNRCYFTASHVLEPSHAGARRRAIDMNRTGSALRDAAAELGASELQMLPDHP